MLDLIRLFQFITFGAPSAYTVFSKEINRIEVRFQGLKIFTVWETGGVEIDLGSNQSHQPIQTIIRRVNYCIEKVEFFTDHRFGKVILRRGFTYFERAGALHPFEGNRLFRFRATQDLAHPRSTQKIEKNQQKALPPAGNSLRSLMSQKMRERLQKR
jgi:hypothetical protein